MAVCANCGKEIDADTKFCPNCGKPTGMGKGTSQRQQEYAGKIIKCPSCGMELASFTAICPGCGHEINSTKVEESVHAFIGQIDSIDKVIAVDEAKLNRGWHGWDIKLKIGWILLNICTCFIPLSLYYVVLLFFSSPTLLPAEKRKTDIIENATFPNEREAILEASLFIRTKIGFLTTEKCNVYTSYWTKIWSEKADGLQQKSQIMLQGDPIAKETFEQIDKEKTIIRKKFQMQAIFSFVVSVLLLLGLFIGKSFVLSGGKNVYAHFNWPTEGLCEYIPEPSTTNGKIETNTETRFELYMYHVTREQFDTYLNSCKQKGFDIDIERYGDSWYAYNDEGCKLHLSYNENGQLYVLVVGPMKTETIIWPQSELVKNIPKPESNIGKVVVESTDWYNVYIANTTKEQYDAYVEACINNGFNIDYSKSNNHFSAKDSNGYNLDVGWEASNVMEIAIDKLR